MNTLIDEVEMLDILRAFVREAGTQKAAAIQLGISGMYVSDIVNGRRPISDAVAQKLGYRRSWRFEYTQGELN